MPDDVEQIDRSKSAQVNGAMRPWFVRLAEATHPLFLPCIVGVLLALPYFFGDFEGTALRFMGMSVRQLQGTAALFTLMPVYFLAVSYYAWVTVQGSLIALKPQIAEADQQLADQALASPGWVAGVLMILGVAFGLQDFSSLDWWYTPEKLSWFDFWFRFASAILWASVGWLLAWRLYSAWAMYRLGQRLQLDVYQLNNLGAFVRPSLADVLIIMGSMALMPLQALDFDLRWVNYRSGLMIGLPSAIALFAFPIWGLHQNMRRVIDTRLVEIQSALDACERNDFPKLSMFTEHRAAVKGFSAWPINVGLISKALFYLVIPPLAWIAAALVEQAVERFVG